MSYERLTDEELEDLIVTLAARSGLIPAQESVYRALRELAELRQAAEPDEVKPLPEDYWESAE